MYKTDRTKMEILFFVVFFSCFDKGNIKEEDEFVERAKESKVNASEQRAENDDENSHAGTKLFTANDDTLDF